jgi:hypothetical protein
VSPFILSDSQLTDRANSLLGEAEHKYLGRDQNYQFLGITYHQDGPHIRFTPDYRGMHIVLFPSTKQYPDQALHQVAHEVIHLLAPDRHPPAIMLEEGLATHFSIHAPQFQVPSYREEAPRHIMLEPSAKNFRDALYWFEQLTAIEPNAIVILRSAERNFYSMTPQLIQREIPKVSREFADRLCERRQMR